MDRHAVNVCAAQTKIIIVTLQERSTINMHLVALDNMSILSHFMNS